MFIGIRWHLPSSFHAMLRGKPIAARAFFSVILAIFVITASAIGVSQPAQALPSFARQTGQPCGTCHTDYPGLTPYGRLFKLNGYTTGGGKYRTTPFPSWAKPTDALAAYAKKANGTADTTLSGQPDTSNIWVPPISAMTIVGYTRTKADQVNGPPFSPYHPNNNVAVSPISFFYGGAITEHIGMFAQVTDAGAAFVPSTTDPYATFQWTWDNTDLRYANTMTLGNLDIIFGITANNNPSVQDVWNTTPAWRFPYTGTAPTQPGPAAATLIDGSFPTGNAIGVGGYAFIDNLLYLELTGYRSLGFKQQVKLGVDPFSVGKIDGVAPYWRVALEPHWGNHWLEFGAYGLSARLKQWDGSQLDSNGWQLPVSLPQTDRFNDIAFDAQYQYQGPNYWITLRGTYIHESQQLNASFNAPAGALSNNPTNTLNTFRADASLAYGNDNRFVLTGQYFDTRGSTDASWFGVTSQFDPLGLFPSTKPDSNGYVFELDYIPFVSSQSPIWPWANMKLGIQYTYYNKFDGDTMFAHDNNTLFLYAWFAL